jgi:hypothetical protein
MPSTLRTESTDRGAEPMSETEALRMVRRRAVVVASPCGTSADPSAIGATASFANRGALRHPPAFSGSLLKPPTAWAKSL